MAAKVFFLLALIAVVVNAENDCDCDPPTDEESKALWTFLSKLSSEVEDPAETEMRAVLPGVLSPLLECNCLEKNRKKRKIMPEVESEDETENIKELVKPEEETVRQKKSIHFKTTRCPAGHAWIGIMCVPEEYLD